MSRVLIYDEETGTYVTHLKKKVKEVRKSVKDVSKEEVTLKDIYELLVKVLELLEEFKE